MAAGDIHIWDRESAALLHHVRAQALGGDLTCIAWNHAMEQPFMFATGSHDGGVRIWTTPQDFSAPNADPIIPPSRTTTNPVNTPENTPRSRPLLLYGIEQQTESPEEETTFELQGPTASAGVESGNI